MAMKIRGTVLNSRKAFVKENLSEQDWEKVLQSLSDEDQHFFKDMLISSGWYPFDIAERLDKAIADVLGKGNFEIFKEIGAKSARKNLLPMQPGDVLSTYADIQELITDFDFQPRTSIAQGLEKFVSWYQEYYQASSRVLIAV